MSDSQLPETIDPEEARRLLGTGQARSIDMRDESVLAGGHAPATVVVGERSLKEAAEQVLAVEQVPILVFGTDGGESERGAEELREAGIEAVAIEGGWSGWQSAGLPVQPRDDQEYEGPDLAQPGTGA